MPGFIVLGIREDSPQLIGEAMHVVTAALEAWHRVAIEGKPMHGSIPPPLMARRTYCMGGLSQAAPGGITVQYALTADREQLADPATDWRRMVMFPDGSTTEPLDEVALAGVEIIPPPS